MHIFFTWLFYLSFIHFVKSIFVRHRGSAAKESNWIYLLSPCNSLAVYSFIQQNIIPQEQLPDQLANNYHLNTQKTTQN